MADLTGKWKRLTIFQRGLILIAIILAVLVGFRYVDFGALPLPLPRTIEQQEAKLQELRTQLGRVQEQSEQQQDSLSTLQENVQPFLWRIGDNRPDTEIQAELERIARTERVTIRTMGSPRTAEITEHVQSVEISLNLIGTMREISRFLAALERSQRKFYWVSCRIRPNNVRNVESINLTGRVEALFLTPDAEQIIFGRQG